MAEDKYAPKGTDDTNQVHHLHKQMIKDQQETNKKLRHQAAQKKTVPPQAEKADEQTNPTQPPVSEQPQNPDAPANQPV